LPPNRPERGVVRLLPALVLLCCLPAVAADDSRARQNYMLNCQGCHRADGSGSPGKVPDFRGSLGRFLEVPGGREFIVQVPGVASTPLDDAELAEVLNWTLRNYSAAQLPADFTPYAAQEVGRLRQDVRIDVDTERKRLMESIDRLSGQSP
jgi:mono/diheme cytochrome c family protein